MLSEQTLHSPTAKILGDSILPWKINSTWEPREIFSVGIHNINKVDDQMLECHKKMEKVV